MFFSHYVKQKFTKKLLTEQTLEFLYLFQSLRQIPGLSRDTEAMNANKKTPVARNF